MNINNGWQPVAIYRDRNHELNVRLCADPKAAVEGEDYFIFGETLIAVFTADELLAAIRHFSENHSSDGADFFSDWEGRNPIIDAAQEVQP